MSELHSSSNSTPPPIGSYENRLVGTWLTTKPDPSAWLVVLGTIAIMALASQAYWQNWLGLGHQMAASGLAVFENFEWWRLFSAIFIHADMEHFLSNMYMLGILTYFVYGFSEKLIFPLAAIPISALVNLWTITSYAPETKLVGASGLVYVLAGFWMFFYFLIQRQYTWKGRLLRITGVSLLILFPSTYSPTTSYRAHFFGFILGAALGFFYFHFRKKEIRSAEVYRKVPTDDEFAPAQFN